MNESEVNDILFQKYDLAFCLSAQLFSNAIDSDPTRSREEQGFLFTSCTFLFIYVPFLDVTVRLLWLRYSEILV